MGVSLCFFDNGDQDGSRLYKSNTLKCVLFGTLTIYPFNPFLLTRSGRFFYGLYYDFMVYRAVVG
jgi:hypothetical protein